MAYTTLYYFAEPLTTDQITARNNYISTQVTAGNTNGINTTVTKTGVVDSDNNPLSLNERSWASNDSATAFVDFLNTFSPAPTYAQVVAPL